MQAIKSMSNKWQVEAHQLNKRTEFKVVSTERKMKVLNVFEFWNDSDSITVIRNKQINNDTLHLAFSCPENYKIYNKAYDNKIEIADGQGFTMYIKVRPVTNDEEFAERVKYLSEADTSGNLWEIPESKVKAAYKNDSITWIRTKTTGITNDLGEENYVLFNDKMNQRIVSFNWLDTYKVRRRKKLSQFIAIIKSCNFD